MTTEGVMQSVREYCEGEPVSLRRHESGRLVIQALNEAGYNSTEVDLQDVLDWCASHLGWQPIDWETLFQMADQPCVSGPGEIPCPGSPSDYNELRTALENLLKWPTSPAMQETARDVLARLTAPAHRGRTMTDYLNPIHLSDLVWCYADDKAIKIVVQHTHNIQTFKLTWKRLDRLRRQAAEARAEGKYRP